MARFVRAALAIAVAAVVADVAGAYAAQVRDSKVRAAFQREHPCPDPAIRIKPGTAGGRRGACPGFEIDHIEPLCAGGADVTWNMQWLTIELHKLKTRDDVRRCRLLKKKAR